MTLDKPVTEEGRIVGTIQYMAPETLTRGQVDERSDIFSLGLLLYEMATGRAAFAASSKASLMAAIVEHEAPALPATVHPHLSHIIGRCLEKDPDQRWQSAGDVAAELRWLQSQIGRAEVPRSRRHQRPWMAGILILITAAVAIIPLTTGETPEPTITRQITSIMIEEPPLLLRFPWMPVALSPNGRNIAYISGSPPRIRLRSLSDANARTMDNTEGAWRIFFSPDGQWIGFTAGGKLKKVAVAGGDPQIIMDEPREMGELTWGEHGAIVFDSSGELRQVSASGGVAAPVRNVQAGDLQYRTPSFLPGGKQLLITVERRGEHPNRAKIGVLDISSGETKILTDGWGPRYSATGHLLFTKFGRPNTTGTLYSIEFDPQTLRVSGSPTPRLTDMDAYQSPRWAVAADGTVAYVPRDSNSQARDLVWFDRVGRWKTATTRTIDHYVEPVLSPDAKHIAYSDWENIWICDIGRDLWFPVATARSVQDVRWSPDSKQLVYETIDDGIGRSIYTVAADGSKPPALVIAGGEAFRHPSGWSPDGRFIALSSGHRNGDIWVVDVEKKRTSKITDTPNTGEWAASFSPDGRWIAYDSAVDANSSEIHVRPFPGQGPRHVVFTGIPCPPAQPCWHQPRWSPDGREMFFRSTNKLMAVDVDTTSGEFRSGVPHVLFEAEFDDFDVSPDGTRFIAARRTRQPRWDHLNIVTGWWND